MPDIRRTFSAVFRYLPDAAGDIRMIHNGESRTEVGPSVEELWFRIDNRTPVRALYDAFLEIIGQVDARDPRDSFAAILRHFQASGYVETTLSEVPCPACERRYDPLAGALEAGVFPGTRFDDLPPDWTCPGCGTPKRAFVAPDPEATW